MDASGTDRACQRLADVVEEGGQAKNLVRARLFDDGDRMGEDVLVPLNRVLLESQGRKLGKELRCETRFDEEPESRRRVRQDDQLVQLISDSLLGDDLEPRAQRLDRSDQLGIG